MHAAACALHSSEPNDSVDRASPIPTGRKPEQTAVAGPAAWVRIHADKSRKERDDRINTISQASARRFVSEHGLGREDHRRARGRRQADPGLGHPRLFRWRERRGLRGMVDGVPARWHRGFRRTPARSRLGRAAQRHVRDRNHRRVRRKNRELECDHRSRIGRRRRCPGSPVPAPSKHRWARLRNSPCKSASTTRRPNPSFALFAAHAAAFVNRYTVTPRAKPTRR